MQSNGVFHSSLVQSLLVDGKYVAYLVNFRNLNIAYDLNILKMQITL